MPGSGIAMRPFLFVHGSEEKEDDFEGGAGGMSGLRYREGPAAAW